MHAISTRPVDDGIFGDRAAEIGGLGEYIDPGAAADPIQAWHQGVLGEYYRGGSLAPLHATRDGIFGEAGLGPMSGLGDDLSTTDQYVALGVGLLIRGAVGAAVGAVAAPRGQETGWVIGGIVATGLFGLLGVGGLATVALLGRR